MAYTRNPRKRVVRGASEDELRSAGRRRSEELNPDEFDMPFVRLGSSAIGTGQDVVQRVGNSIIGGDFSGNARGEKSLDIQVERTNSANVASGLNAIVLGVGGRAAGDYSMAFGAASVDAESAVGLGGVGIRTGADRSTAVGTDSGILENSYGSVLVGDQSTIYEDSPRSVLLGVESFAGNTTPSPDAILIGHDSFIDASSGILIGGHGVVTGDRAVVIGEYGRSYVDDQAVIVATALKMQTSVSPLTYESVITTADTPTAGNLAAWTDSDGIEDAGVAVSALVTMIKSRSEVFLLMGA